MGVTLPGTLLLPLLTRWGVGDGRAGLLFFVFFLGSSSGAVLSRGSIGRSVSRGCGIAAFGVAGLSSLSYSVALVAITIYGLGLGIAMTSVSLLQSRRNAAHRTAEMTRLNFIWAIGACLGPATLLRGSATWGVQPVLEGVVVLFACLGAAALRMLPSPAAPASSLAQFPRSSGKKTLLLLLLGPLATGVESGMGGWLALYSQRSGHVLNITISAVTFFWGGLLVSRLIQSSRYVAGISRRPTLQLAPALIFSGISVLVASHGGGPMLLGALLVGLGVGPLYPLMLSLLLAHGEVRNAGFILGGVGAALLPLLMGLVSAWSGSIRFGLGVLLLASMAMGAINVALLRDPVIRTGDAR